MAESKVVRVVQLTSAHWVFDTRIFHKISKTLAQAGYEVILVARHEHDEVVDGIRIAAVPRTRGRLRRLTVTLRRIYRKALELDGDIYHFHDPELIPVGLLLKHAGKHVVYDAHEDLPRTISYKDYLPGRLHKIAAWAAERLEQFAARKVTAVIGATPLIANRFRHLNPRTAVVHNFPILEETRLPPWAQRTSTIAYVGSISRERGIFELLEAMNKLQTRAECRLALAGWFSPLALKDEINRLPAAGKIDFLGRLSQTEVAELLARVRIGLAVLHPEPNFLHSKPTKLFEYMCAGVPVVASDFPLWREIIDDAGCGLLVDPLNTDRITEAIEYLLSHPSEAEEMGRNGRAAAERLFSWNTEARTLIALYRGILQHDSVADHTGLRPQKSKSKFATQ